MARSLIDHIEKSLRKGPDFEEATALPVDAAPKGPLNLIAYYLPQFHHIEENDRWWGEGFTEWSNVTRAIPRYEGHYQPRGPGRLGFYDLSRVEVLENQVALAKRAGVNGFCFHHYWFSGTKILHTPLDNLLSHPEIDLQFCVNWANENWTRRWDGGDTSVLMKQDYNEEDASRLADELAEIAKDPRYICVDGQPLIMFYRPDDIPGVQTFLLRFRARFAEIMGVQPFLVAPQAFDIDADALALDALAGFPPHGGGSSLHNYVHEVERLDPDLKGSVHSYDDLITRMLANHGGKVPLMPGVCPGWDNSARRGPEAGSFFGSTPKAYGWWLEQAAAQAAAEQPWSEKFVFINAWNEWAEGAYLEPDRHVGYALLAETRRVRDRISRGEPPRTRPPAPTLKKRVATTKEIWKARLPVLARLNRQLKRLRQATRVSS